MQKRDITGFKSYDVRGKVPDELNEEIAYHIGIAYAQFLMPRKVVVGRDVRISSEGLCRALSEGLMDSGVDVFDIGLCGTEMVYFSTFYEKMGGGIMVTASHNPKDYNGMKFVREQAKPISGDSGLNIIRDLTRDARKAGKARKGEIHLLDIKEKYIKHLLGYIDINTLRPYKIVVNAGNGCAGMIIDMLERHLPFTFIKINHEPDGAFPNGVPNPLLSENREATITAIKEHNADIGIAWDGDFDRCLLFDGQGNFIEGYYIVGLLASAILEKHPGAKIIHDPRLTWNTIDIVTKAGGIPVMSKTGHAFIKERMRMENALYGGEMSAHHYFRDFSFCDSGMIPWLMAVEIMRKTGKPLSELVKERMKIFPVSGEINRRLGNPDAAIKFIEDNYGKDAVLIDYTDGLSMEFSDWRFNLRSSNTEPMVRLNVEARGNADLMREKTNELLECIDAFQA
ncbi:MAG: phosphomannomutase CpsG [Thermodesulfovibrionales bacterium]|nr:phosphomannomutase CpsG [Thermodesulfovibrionales bacterium]